MKGRSVPLGQSIIAPSVLVGIVYFGLVSTWGLWVVCTAQPATTGSGEVFRALSTTRYQVVSGINAVLALGFLLDALGARSRDVAVRRAHLAGITLAAIVLVFVQVGAHLAHGPFNWG